MTIDLLDEKTVVHNFLRVPQSTFPTLQSTFQMESSCSSTQTKITTSSNIVKLSFKYHIWKPQKWRLIYWSKRPFFTIFCGFRKVRFQRYSPQFRLNQAVLLRKQRSRLPLTSLKLPFKYHIWKPQKWRLIYWSKRPFFTIFCGFRKVRFIRYSPQFRWNQAVLLLKQWSRLPLTSLKLSFKYQLCKPH